MKRHKFAHPARFCAKLLEPLSSLTKSTSADDASCTIVEVLLPRHDRCELAVLGPREVKGVSFQVLEGDFENFVLATTVINSRNALDIVRSTDDQFDRAIFISDIDFEDVGIDTLFKSIIRDMSTTLLGTDL